MTESDGKISDDVSMSTFGNKLNVIRYQHVHFEQTSFHSGTILCCRNFTMARIGLRQCLTLRRCIARRLLDIVCCAVVVLSVGLYVLLLAQASQCRCVGCRYILTKYEDIMWPVRVSQIFLNLFTYSMLSVVLLSNQIQATNMNLHPFAASNETASNWYDTLANCTW